VVVMIGTRVSATFFSDIFSESRLDSVISQQFGDDVFVVEISCLCTFCNCLHVRNHRESAQKTKKSCDRYLSPRPSYASPETFGFFPSSDTSEKRAPSADITRARTDTSVSAHQ
jgi:hypothetical protein